ncbi:MAG: polysaccharide biosynthesis tyrosine autokinase [Alphaproteobacteria bacterium]|nr:polysaccharide biosynthesis tyrosine autokinase [Alphaproteobacteria bacterium]
MSPYRPHTSLSPAQYVPRGFAPPPYAPATFQMADFIRLLDARRTLILKILLATVLCALATALVLPTTYSSSAVVILDPRKNNVTDLSAVLTPLGNDPAAVQNQIQIITSRGLASTVVDRLKLYDDPEFNPGLAQPSLVDLVGEMFSLLNPKNWFENITPTNGTLSRDRVVDTLQKHVWADTQGLSTTITISASSREAGKAALIANTLADAYVKSQVAAKVGATTATTDWLNRRLQDLSQQLQIQQEAIQRYKAEHNLNDSAPGNSIVDQQMVGISAQVVAARSVLAEKNAINDRIGQLVSSGNPADVAQIVSSPLIVGLRTQQATLLAQESEANTKYGPLHPKLQIIQEQKRDLSFKITQEVNRLAASAANDVLVARAQLNSLQGSLGGTEGTARTQNMARVQLQAMESNATSTRTMYEAFVQRLRQSQNLDDVQVPESRIISSASVPRAPAGPKRMLILGASLPLGLILGVLAALIVEKLGPLMPMRVNGARRATIVPPIARPMRRAAKPRSPVAVWSGPPILGEINDTAQLRAADFVLDYPASRYSHAIAALVRQLEAKDSKGGAAIVAITSVDAGESRSAIAVSLARAASKMGKKAIIVDCAPQRLVSKAIKAPTKTGLYDVLTGAVPLNQALAKDPRGETYLLATPKRPKNAVTMFQSRPMERLVSVLRGGADFVVIDCGPVSRGSDAAVIARLADATVLVSKRQALHSPLIAQAARALENAKAAPLGIVITK